MEALLLKYGYYVLFLGVLVEGEAFLIAGAVLAHQGVFALPMVIILSTIANSVANQIYYFAARARGREWLEARYGSDKRFQRITSLVERRGPLLLLVSRFLYGLRLWICAACGAFGMGLTTFSVLSVLSSALWVVPTAYAAYYASATLLRVLHDAHRAILWVALAAGVVVATVFALRHVRKSFSSRDVRLSDLHAIVPLFMGLMGLVNIASAILPRTPSVLPLHLLPFAITQRSRPLMLFAGVALLQVTVSLARRKSLGWYVATIALAISFVSHLGRALDFQHSLVAGLLLVYLVAFRKRFYAWSDPGSVQRALATAPLLVAAVLVYGGVGLDRNQARFEWPRKPDPWREAFRVGILITAPEARPLTPRVEEFQASIGIAGWLARVYLLILLLRPVVRSRRDGVPAEVLAGLARPQRRSLSVLAADPDKHHLLLASGRAVVAYSAVGGVAMACGDPVCAEGEVETSIREYQEWCDRRSLIPCFYLAAEDHLPVYQDRGLSSVRIALEATVDLRLFSLEGGPRARLRQGVRRASREGLEVVRYQRAGERQPGLDEAMEEISSEWLEERHLGEPGFSFGRFSLDSLDGDPIFLCRRGDRVEAFCTFRPYWNGNAMVLEVLRRRTRAPGGTLDLLLARSLEALKGDGLLEASLSPSPLSGSEELQGPSQKGVALLFENLNRLYGYKNLSLFKEKFAPSWEPRHLVFPRGADLRRIASVVSLVHRSGRLVDQVLGR
jgi:phosphatidylglycerol lysyltransferase